MSVSLDQLLVELDLAKADVWEAFESTLMSDAKERVYALLNMVRDQRLPMPNQEAEQFMGDILSAYNALIGEGSTYDRAQRCHALLAKAEQLLMGFLP